MDDLNGHKRTELTREELKPLVMSGAPVATIAKALDGTPSAVRRAIRRLGLPQPAEVRRAQIADAARQGLRELVRACPRHGETEFAIVGSENRLHCKRCRAEAVARRRRKVKTILVEEAGGKCQLCGYDRCINALEFHHPDPGQKSFGLAHRGITRALDQVREEARKCVLLCSNCHAEVEAGFANLPIKLRGAVFPK